MNIIEEYSKFSGLKANRDKTEALWIGRDKTSSEKPSNIKWNSKGINILGIYFSHNQDEMVSENLKRKIEDSEKLINIWKRRNLTLIGRIQVVKTFIIPKFLYLSSSMVIPKNYVERIQKLIRNFIWKGNHRIKYNTLISSIENGGLNLPYLETKIYVHRITIIKRYLCDDKPMWKGLVDFFFNNVGGLKFLLKCNYSLKNLPIMLPDFYNEMLFAWLRILERMMHQVHIYCLTIKTF